MINNFLYPDTMPALTEGLLSRAEPKAPEDVLPILAVKLVKHFHRSPDDAAWLAAGPANGPAWARDKSVCLPAPSARLLDDIKLVSQVLAESQSLIAAGVLRSDDSQLLARLGSLRRGLPHSSWPTIVARCQALHVEVVNWRVARRPVMSPLVVPGAEGRQWRRLCSYHEIWRAARGTSWCVRKEAGFGPVGLNGEPRQLKSEFWVLERRGQTAALLSLLDGSHINQVRDNANGVRTSLRPDVQAFMLARDVGVASADWVDDWDWDLGTLALDRHLGLPGQPAIEGRVGTAGLGDSIRFKLWADGRRGRYIAAFPNGEPQGCEARLRLDIVELTEFGSMLTGLTPSHWSGSPWDLMGRVLEVAGQRRPRYRHFWRAQRLTRIEGRAARDEFTVPRAPSGA
jgi:hypothetical protein